LAWFGVQNDSFLPAFSPRVMTLSPSFGLLCQKGRAMNSGSESAGGAVLLCEQLRREKVSDFKRSASFVWFPGSGRGA